MVTKTGSGTYRSPDQTGLDFWSRTLDGGVTTIGFPHDYTLEEADIYKESITLTFPSEIQVKLYEMTRQSHLGVYMILVSSVKYLLSRYTGSRDIVVGLPVIDVDAHIQSVNHLVLSRSKLTAGMTIRDWISAMKETITEAFRHQEVPFDDIVQRAGLVHPDGVKPLVQTLVRFKPIQSKADIGDIYSEAIFDFDIVEGSLTLNLKYSKSLFCTETMEYLANAILLYHVSLLENTSMKLDDIEWVTETDRDKILYQFNKPAVVYPDVANNFQQLFEEQVSLRAEQTALVFDQMHWTYRELNDHADRLAYLLIHKYNLTREEAVAVCMQRSPSVYIAMLAIWKAGGVFVPVDPVVPAERVTDIFTEARVRIVLTNNFHKLVLNDIRNKCKYLDHVICTDADEFEASKVDGLPLGSTGSTLAYIIFTSGSTGKPKGVEIEHLSIVRFLQAIDQVIAPVSPRAILNSASISFDLFISEALYGLFKGIQVVIANEREHINSAELARLVEENHINVMMITPSRLQLLMNHHESMRALLQIKMFLIGGQEMKPSFLQEIQHLTQARIVNVYGPTETTCLATAALLNGSSQVTIGRPLENYRCYIVDERSRLQLIGAVGELLIGGSGIARGYVNNQSLTEEKFIPDPFHAGQRLYKTGDLARWLPNGDIQCLGRMDNQIKIRGYRIETSDVETAMLSHPDIREAVVLVNQDQNGEISLTAYFVSDKEWGFNIIYDYLKQKLPAYMVPVHYVRIPALPLTVNGKIDASALVGMEHLKLSGGSLYRAPGNDIQQVLVELWQQLLEVECVGIDDDFFQIGGTSLSGVKMVALLSDRYTISINDIFDYPTIAELSLHVVEQEGYFHHLLEVMKPSTMQAAAVPIETKDEAFMSYLIKAESWRNRDLSLQKHYKHILLTGGTGFLGTHLLGEILKRTNASVTLLVRGESAQSARKYARERFKHYLSAEDEKTDWTRVSVACGDITMQRLGLNPSEYEELSDTVDCIFHTASLTRHYGTAEEFDNVNIQGTRHILDFAAFHQIKDIHYTSNMSIGTGSDIQVFSEFTEEVGPIDEGVNNHFLRSKAEVEAILRSGRDKGLNCTIYRLNSLNNNTRTEKFMINKESNAFYSFVTGLNSLGLFPDLHEPVLDLTGVDQAAEALITLFDRPAIHNKNHHIFNPHRISWGQFGRELQSMNRDLKLVDFDFFIDTLTERFNHAATRRDVINVILNLFLLRHTEWLGYMRVCDRTEEVLRRLGFKWDAVNKRQIACYLS